MTLFSCEIMSNHYLDFNQVVEYIANYLEIKAIYCENGYFASYGKIKARLDLWRQGAKTSGVTCVPLLKCVSLCAIFGRKFSIGLRAFVSWCLCWCFGIAFGCCLRHRSSPLSERTLHREGEEDVIALGIELQHSQAKLQGLSAVCAQYQPRIPPALEGGNVKALKGDNTTTVDPSDRLAVSRAYPHTFGQPLVHLVPVSGSEAKSAKHSPIRIGVALNCGRQSPGGHNIITGLHDALKSQNTDSTLIGFIGGTEGIFAQKTVDIQTICLRNSQSG